MKIDIETNEKYRELLEEFKTFIWKGGENSKYDSILKEQKDIRSSYLEDGSGWAKLAILAAIEEPCDSRHPRGLYGCTNIGANLIFFYDKHKVVANLDTLILPDGISKQSEIRKILISEINQFLGTDYTISENGGIKA
jgi:hypothetical protein